MAQVYFKFQEAGTSHILDTPPFRFQLCSLHGDVNNVAVRNVKAIVIMPYATNDNCRSLRFQVLQLVIGSRVPFI